MFFVTYILLMCLALPSILAMPSEQDVMESNIESKINWGPVWDDLEGNNEFVVRMQDDVADEGKFKATVVTIQTLALSLALPR